MSFGTLQIQTLNKYRPLGLTVQVDKRLLWFMHITNSICYTGSTYAEDRATLESDLSAVMGYSVTGTEPVALSCCCTRLVLGGRACHIIVVTAPQWNGLPSWVIHAVPVPVNCTQSVKLKS